MGTATTRCGYAGEDSPRADLPSWVGAYQESALDAMEDGEKMVEKYLLDTQALHVPKEGQGEEESGRG